MSDVANKDEFSGHLAQDHAGASAEKKELQLVKTESLDQDANTASMAAVSETNGAILSATGLSGQDADSEAETWIESPEKKRAGNDKIVGPHFSREAVSNHDSSQDENAPDGGSRARKRKRGDDEAADPTESPASSRRSSPLSSPTPHIASIDSDSDIGSNRNPKEIENTRTRRRNGFDRDLSRDSEEEVQRPSGSSIKVRRRRPSDILPPSANHRQKAQNNSIVAGNVTERRETRSATYPRHSSGDRSLSPEPISRREHRRGASTQLTSLALEKRRRAQPPHINTRRNHSADRHSVSSDASSSAGPSRPRLHKYASADHEIMSPAKAMGRRKDLDRSGQTAVAKNCRSGNLEKVKQFLSQQPEDLNYPDYAGNTPLQIAALEGFVDIVKFLLEKGCDIDTKNMEKDTPLIDAIDNYHVDVIKILLEHGANPRLGNANGDEPYDIAHADRPHYHEIRKLIAEARERDPKRRKSNDQADSGNREGSSRAASAASPRDSPPAIGPKSPPLLTSRRRTGRSESTRHDLLWQANTQENLTRLAGKGDLVGVANILEILGKAESESLIAAAKAGHEQVVSHLLALGNPDPDPEPIRSGNLKSGSNTPMLAAIGRGNLDIVRLLVNQSGFNPSRTVRGRTYFEISQDRKGEQWQAEYEILKTAYDDYISSKQGKHASPRKTRDLEKGKLRQNQDSTSPMVVKHRPETRSPALSHKSLPDHTSAMSREGKHDEKIHAAPIDRVRSHQQGRKSASDRSVAVTSDLDQEDNTTRKTQKIRRSQSDLPLPMDLDAETYQRRRRLVTGKEHRRAASSAVKGSLSDEDATITVGVKQERGERQALKRPRSSMSPEPAAFQESGNATKVVSKKRRTIPDSASPEEVRSTPRKRVVMEKSNEESEQTIEVRSRDQNSIGDVDKNSEGHKSTPSVSSQSQQDIPIGDAMEDVTATSVEDTERPGDVSVIPEVPKPSKEEIAAQEAAIEAEKERERLAAEEAATEVARKVREAEEAAAEEKRLLEEAEAEAKRKAEEAEAEAKRKAEEEAAARKKEEEERQQQLKREIEERRRRQEEQKRQEFLENEKRRREALPIVLCHCALMLDQGDPTVRSHTWLSKFLPLFTVKTRQLDPNCAPDMAEEEWIPNFQVAGLLATKDLNLRQYTSLERRAVSPQERDSMWKVGRNMLSFEYSSNALNTSIEQAIEREKEMRPKFYAMEELFWVKLSDFQDQVFRHSHLSGLNLKKQPISVRPYSVTTTPQPSPKPGTTPKAFPLTNGVTSYMA